jgi:hypothetical protein
MIGVFHSPGALVTMSSHVRVFMQFCQLHMEYNLWAIYIFPGLTDAIESSSFRL